MRSNFYSPMTPAAPYARPVVTDLSVHFFPRTVSPSTCEPDAPNWYRLDKDLCLYGSQQQAWLCVALAEEENLTDEDLLVVDIRIGEPPTDPGLDHMWEHRSGEIWLLRQKFSGRTDQAVTAVDVLFGEDAVDPRPQWKLYGLPLQLGKQSGTPIARLSVLFGRSRPITSVREVLRAGEDGKFKIVQISDTHMVTGVGICKDALGPTGECLPESEADPLTVRFIREILDIEEPDLVVLTGDQVHHDVLDTQSALFKVAAPIIARSTPFAAVFGNHDSEGAHALSREVQMSILQSLPFNLSEAGSEQIEGTGNFCLNILAPAPSQSSLSTLYFLDSHGQIPSEINNPDYDTIKPSQIDWFIRSCHERRDARREDDNVENVHLSLVFQHIPLPEFTDSHLCLRSGRRREASEGPSRNSGFYNVMLKEGISAFGCGHDHVNDFCALLSHQMPQNGDKPTLSGPWLCYGGTSGFGGYCSYGTERFHRKMRVWELDTHTGGIKTWLRVEYSMARVDELVLVSHGRIVDKAESNTEPKHVQGTQLEA